MEDDNIIPYETSPTLTVKQAVMRMLGCLRDFIYTVEEEAFDYDLYDYVHDLQDEADAGHGNAVYELELLKQDNNASPEAITSAEEQVATAKAKLEKAKNLPKIAECYRLLISHEISKVRLGKKSPLVIDEDESHNGKPRIITASFKEWLEGMELGDDATGDYAPVALPVDEDAFDKDLGRKSAVSLYVTLGLLVSMFAESSGDEFGTGQKPKIINISKEIDKYAKQLNDDFPLDWQQTQAIRRRIELALSALKSCI